MGLVSQVGLGALRLGRESAADGFGGRSFGGRSFGGEFAKGGTGRRGVGGGRGEEMFEVVVEGGRLAG